MIPQFFSGPYGFHDLTLITFHTRTWTFPFHIHHHSCDDIKIPRLDATGAYRL